jgi:hypothetical protein
MKIRLGGSRGKAGALYGIEQIRASGAYAIPAGAEASRANSARSIGRIAAL